MTWCAVCATVASRQVNKHNELTQNIVSRIDRELKYNFVSSQVALSIAVLCFACYGKCPRSCTQFHCVLCWPPMPYHYSPLTWHAPTSCPGSFCMSNLSALGCVDCQTLQHCVQNINQYLVYICDRLWRL